MSSSRIAAALAALLALAACSERGPLTLMPVAAEIGTVHDVFVATSRAYTVDGLPTGQRGGANRYSKLSIAVPPNREPGSVSVPTELPDPHNDFLVTADQQFDKPDAFRNALRSSLNEQSPRAREVILYVHGFNNTFAEGVLRIAQLDHDIALPGVAVHYSWPSLASALAYGYDRDSALFARDGLESLIREIRRAGTRHLTVVGHSMGALLTMETLRQMSIAAPGTVHRTVNAVVLLSPDIDVTVFQAQARRIDPLPEEFIIFTSERDRALALSARLTGQATRLGNIADATAVGDLPITIIDVTAFSSGLGHFTAGSSPAVISLTREMQSVSDAFREDRAGRAGLLPGTVLTVQNATQVILAPGQTRAP